MKSNPNSELFLPLKKELASYEKAGIVLSLQGRKTNSYKIAKICTVSEETSTYMRDYIPDENGNIKEINFQKVKVKQNL